MPLNSLSSQPARLRRIGAEEQARLNAEARAKAAACAPLSPQEAAAVYRDIEAANRAGLSHPIGSEPSRKHRRRVNELNDLLKRRCPVPPCLIGKAALLDRIECYLEGLCFEEEFFAQEGMDRAEFIRDRAELADLAGQLKAVPPGCAHYPLSRALREIADLLTDEIQMRDCAETMEAAPNPDEGWYLPPCNIVPGGGRDWEEATVRDRMLAWTRRMRRLAEKVGEVGD